MTHRLRVGVLLESLELRAWESTLLKRIKDSPFAHLVVIVLCGSPSSLRDYDVKPQAQARNPLSRLSAWVLQSADALLEGKIQCEDDAFALQDGKPLLAGIPAVNLTPATRKNGDHFPAEELDGLRRFDVDVLVDLGSRKSGGGMSLVAKYGAWSFDQDDYCDHAAPAGFWQVYFGWPVTTMVLQMLDKDGGRPQVLARSISGTNRLSVKLTRSSAYWNMLSLLPRKLEQLHRLGEHSFFEQAACEHAERMTTRDCALGSPSHAQLAVHIARNIKRRSAELISRKFTLQQWILLFHVGDALPTSIQQFTKIVPPNDRYWADPHVIKRDGRYYVFVEEYLFKSRKGHISVLEIDSEGKRGAAVKVLERDYHLSYPFVFEHDGTLFMVPESSAARTVELYRCVDFPTKWEFVRYLLNDVFAVDSTLLRHDGKWWLFSNVVENRGASPCDELFLFHAESLLTDQWISHPLNPVVSDVRSARPAGAIFEAAGKLYRPAQDCSVRYGYQIRINEITTLSPHDYGEAEVAAITPDSRVNITATHTLARLDRLTVIDALQPRLSFC